VYVERSRSGNGSHVWLFFSEPIRAHDASALGRLILLETREVRASLDLRSFDRMFPSQDSVAKGKFGNLIALPLQRAPRDEGNSVFLDGDLSPYPGEDQWEVLANVVRIDNERVATLLEAQGAESPGGDLREATPLWRTGDLFGDRNDAGRKPSASRGTQAVTPDRPPDSLDVTFRDRLYVSRRGVPDWLQSRVRDVAMFSNPEYFRKKAARVSTWKTPRVIRCSEVQKTQIALPRGSETALGGLAKEIGLAIRLLDRRAIGCQIAATFKGTLTPVQAEALEALSAHDTGVLVLPTGAGKTVVAHPHCPFSGLFEPAPQTF
jgi:hypothetical protein